ncbi:MAG: FecR domain-containing protein [Dechloromonas sp.]|nr:FecR domain-containing protein [Dechloromonas sp.]
MISKYWRRAAGFGLLVGLLAGGIAQAQQKIGQVDFAQGLATAQRPGEATRFLVRGEALLEGDTITTTDRGYAVLSFKDGSKVTLRPGTSFAVDKFAHDKGEESAVMRLLKGGLRAVTGLIGKRNPGGIQFGTVTATIGIRGTSFDARLCGEDCRKEDQEVRTRPNKIAPLPPADTVIARVVRIQGEAVAVQSGQAARRLFEGAPLQVGDEIRTSAAAVVVIGFRDQTRVSLEPQTVFRVEDFAYDRKNQPDNFAVRLVKGGLRFFTGLLGKRNPGAVSVSTVVATIGIRGTGMDIRCEGPCVPGYQPPPAASTKGKLAKAASAKDRKAAAAKAQAEASAACADTLSASTWDGEIVVTGNRDMSVAKGQSACVGKDGAPRSLAAVPDGIRAFVSPRPDQVEINWDALFGSVLPNGEDGLYALVRDGHVFLLSSGGRLDLGPGEAGYVGADGVPHRLDPIPRFMSDDPFPIPEMFDANDPDIIQLYGVTLGAPDQEICEVQ